MEKKYRYRKVAYTSQPVSFVFTIAGYEFKLDEDLKYTDTISVSLYTDSAAKKTGDAVITAFNRFEYTPDISTPFAPGTIFADITITSADGNKTIFNGIGTEVDITTYGSKIAPTREVRFMVPVESYDIEGPASGE